jgi:uncharacterized protein with GYD domain
MAIYIILSRISPQAFSNPGEFIQLAAKVSEKIKKECPGVTWKNSYSTMGRFDVIDIVEADDQQEIEKLAMIIRAYGRSSTETLLATPWKKFLDIV